MSRDVMEGSVATGEQEDAHSVIRLPRVRGVVLAGVHAWGNCALERALCRPLLPIASRPLIWYPLNWIKEADIRQASVCGNSDTQTLRRRLGRGEGIGIAIDYYEDVMPRGPAGCARDATLATDAEAIVVVDGTVIPCLDLAALLRTHVLGGADVTLVVTQQSVGEGDRKGEYQPTGVYVFARDVLAEVPKSGYQDIKESLIPNLYRRGAHIMTHVVPSALVPRVTDAASYLGVNMWVMERAAREGLGLEGYVRNGDMWVHQSARVPASVQNVGPVLVGPNSWLGDDVVLVGPTTIGTGCRIESRAVVTRSAIWDRSRVGADAVVDQCIVAEGADVEADVVVRHTACLPARRPNGRLVSNGRLVDWLATYCLPTPRRTRRGQREEAGDRPWSSELG